MITRRKLWGYAHRCFPGNLDRHSDAERLYIHLGQLWEAGEISFMDELDAAAREYAKANGLSRKMLGGAR